MSRQQHIDSLERERVAVTRDVEKIAKDARAARSDLGASAKRTANVLRDDAKGAARQIGDDARTVASQAGSDTTDMAKAKVAGSARKTVEAVDPRRFVRQQPVAGLVAGIGIGLLASMFVGVGRRRDEEFIAPDDIM